MPFIFAVSGFKDSGKTTLALYLIQKFQAAGYSVRYVKHTGERHLSSPHTDTGKALALGAETILWTPDGLRMELHNPSLTLVEIKIYFAGCDVVVLEGGKDLALPKIWVGPREKNAPENVTGVIARYDPFSKASENPDVFRAGREEELFAMLLDILKRRDAENVELFSAGRGVPLKNFIARFISESVRGMLGSLRGVTPDEPAALFLKRKKRDDRHGASQEGDLISR